VTRSGDLSGVSNVFWSTADGTATAPSDYTAVGMTLLHFAAHQASAAVTVLVKGDTLVEADETFFVNLGSASGATISDGQGQGTIVNDDAPPGSVALVPDPCFPGKTALQVTGTINSDKIELTNDHGNVKV